MIRMMIMGYWYIILAKQCHKPPITGNGNHTTYKNGDDWGWFVFLFYPHCLESTGTGYFRMITQVFVVFNMCGNIPSNLVFFLGGYWKAVDLTIDYRPSGTYAKHALHDSHDRPNFFWGGDFGYSLTNIHQLFFQMSKKMQGIDGTCDQISG